jgi:hypothetical protein
MKRVFGLFLCLLVVGSGFVFAQEDAANTGVHIGGGLLKFGGEIKTGLRMDTSGAVKNIVGEKTRKDKESIYLFSDDINDNTGFRADLKAAWTNGWLGAKINVRQQFKRSFAASERKLLAVSNAYAWVNLFNNIVTASGGLIDDDIWGTGALGGTGTDKNYDAVGGFRLAFQPLAGLSFGLALPVNEAIRYGVTDYQDFEVGKNPNVEKAKGIDNAYSLRQLFGGSVFGIMYLHEIFGGASVSLRLNRGASYEDTAGIAHNNGNLGVDVLFGLKINPAALPALTVVVDGEWQHLGLDADILDFALTQNLPKNRLSNTLTSTGLDLYAKAQYQVLEPLTLGARFHLKNYISVEDVQTFAAYRPNDALGAKYLDYTRSLLEFRLFGMYAATSWFIPGLEVELALGDKPTKVLDELAVKNAAGNDYAEFKSVSVKPNFTFQLSEGLKFVVFDKITIFGDNFYGNPNGAKSKADFGKGFIKNQLQFDLVWAF